MVLEIVPLVLREANEFVRIHHRHHKPVPGAKFCIGVSNGSAICGIAIVGRPVARMADNGWTLEVNRVATDGTKNACSMLYGAAWRAARALGYRKLITYTLPEEGGASLRGAGWRCLGMAGGGAWGRPSRPRVDLHPLQEKIKWTISGGRHDLPDWSPGWDREDRSAPTGEPVEPETVSDR